jgi:uroporphyrinogen-III synthase
MAGPNPPGDLRRRGVLVTRPVHQAEPLCRRIEAAGGRAVRFPTIAIESAQSPIAEGLLREHWDLVYFVSPNAVTFAQRLFCREGLSLRAARVAAVGQGTARALEATGRPADLVPNGRYESEEVLAMPELARLDGQRALIVRGEGGRMLMAQTLTRRGAEVSIAEVYRRVRPELDPGPLLARWSRDIDLVSVTSEQILLNLVDMLGPDARESLLRTPLVVIAERTAARAETLGFKHVELAERAADDAIVAALCRCP